MLFGIQFPRNYNKKYYKTFPTNTLKWERLISIEDEH